MIDPFWFEATALAGLWAMTFGFVYFIISIAIHDLKDKE